MYGYWIAQLLQFCKTQYCLLLCIMRFVSECWKQVRCFLIYHTGTYLDPLVPRERDKSTQLTSFVIQEAWTPGMDL